MIWNKLFFGMGTPWFGFFCTYPQLIGDPYSKTGTLFWNDSKSGILCPNPWFATETILERLVTGHPHTETGMLSLPVLKQGSPFWNGIANGYVPILKRGSPFQNGEYWHPRSKMGIMPRFWLLVVHDSKDRKKYSPHSEMGSHRSVMGRHQKKSKSGSPRSKKEFVPNQGLTYALHHPNLNLLTGFEKKRM